MQTFETLFSKNTVPIVMRRYIPIVFLLFFSCVHNSESEFQEVKVDAISAVKNEDRFIICLDRPIPKTYFNGFDRILDFELTATYINGYIYKTEGLLVAKDTNQTCFNVQKIKGKWQYSQKNIIERDKIYEEFSDENFKRVKISLMRRKYPKLDTIAVKNFIY